LIGDCTLEGIEEVLSRHPRKPLLPVAGSQAWNRVSDNPVAQLLAKPLRALAEEECAEPLPELTDELYSSFRLTGIRLTFERVYFERRRRLARAVMSFLLCAADDPWRGRLAASTVNKLTSIFEEVSWALPAHVHWHDNADLSGKDPLQIDLFCAETANLMAEVLDLLGDTIPSGLRSGIRDRLLHDVFENYANEENSWRFGWKDASHNWNAVCHQGVVGAALSQLDDPHLLAKILVSARKSLPIFLGGFGNDGGCSEGPGYWSYGFGWFVVLNEQLETRTDGELSLIEGDDHVRAIARYGPRVSLSGGNFVNFSDSGARGDLNPALLTYLGQRLDEPEFLLLARDNYGALLKKGIDLKGERSDTFYLGRIFLRCVVDAASTAQFERKDCFLPDLAVLVARGTDRRGHLWEFAAKAGHNDEHHNHNDCGNFILNIDGVRIFTEIGAPEYVKDFFGPKRYEFLAARSMGHSLPVINGFEQAAGRSFASSVISHTLASDLAEFIVDAGGCYPAAAGCLKFVRSFHFDKSAGALIMEDQFELGRAGSLESAFITIHNVEIWEDHAVISAEGLRVVLKPLPGTKLDRVETHSYRDHGGNEAFVHRLVLSPAVPARIVRLGIGVTLP